MKPIFKHAKWLTAVSVLCRLSFSQIPVFLNPHDPGPLIKETSLELSYNLNETMFLQSSGFSKVTGNDERANARSNPAVLGSPNPRWTQGAVASQYGTIAPNTNLSDFLAFGTEAVYQRGSIGISLGWRYYYFSQTRHETSDSTHYDTDEIGNEWNLSVGKSLGKWKSLSNNLGIGLKYATAPQIYKDSGLSDKAFLVDLGYLAVLDNGFTAALSLQNLGPTLGGMKQAVVRREYAGGTLMRMTYERDSAFSLTPVTMTAGLGYQFAFDTGKTRILKTNLSAAYSLELQQDRFKKYSDYQAYEAGLTLFNTFSQEYGLLLDSKTSSRVIKAGYGLNLFNHLSLGFSLGRSNSFFTDGQKGFYLELFNLLQYRHSDLTWWKK